MRTDNPSTADRKYSTATEIPERYMAEACEARKSALAQHPEFIAGASPGLPLPEYEEIATALMFLDLDTLPPPIKTCKSGTYFWKHVCEWWGEATGRAPYVSTRAFVVAAVWRRLPLKFTENGSPLIGFGARHEEFAGRMQRGRCSKGVASV